MLSGIPALGRHNFEISGYPEKINPGPGILGFSGVSTRDFSVVFRSPGSGFRTPKKPIPKLTLLALGFLPVESAFDE